MFFCSRCRGDLETSYFLFCAALGLFGRFLLILVNREGKVELASYSLHASNMFLYLTWQISLL
jgi:hypothetical protein